jgi:hypothetical protein
VHVWPVTIRKEDLALCHFKNHIPSILQVTLLLPTKFPHQDTLHAPRGNELAHILTVRRLVRSQFHQPLLSAVANPSLLPITTEKRGPNDFRAIPQRQFSENTRYLTPFLDRPFFAVADRIVRVINARGVEQEKNGCKFESRHIPNDMLLGKAPTLPIVEPSVEDPEKEMDGQTLEGRHAGRETVPAVVIVVL